MEHEGNEISIAMHHFKYTLVAQTIVLLLSVLKALFIPKLLSVPDFGYWQIYVLYSSFVGIFALGFNDGVYLIYGRYNYQDLPFGKLRTASRLYCFMLLAVAGIGAVFSVLFASPDRGYALFFVSLDIFIMGLYGLLIYVLQITNQIKAYSFYSVVDKLILLVAVLIIALLPVRNFQQVIAADVLSKVVVTVVLTIKCRNLLFGTGVPLLDGFQEFIQNIKVGINLMIANLMGMFIVGLGRFIVDIFGNIKEYAYYSFGISVTNLVLIVITSVSLVLYPTLKRLDTEKYQKYYTQIDFSVALFGFISLFAYFPAYFFVIKVFPDYQPILVYLNLLFAIIVLQAKMQLLNNTFYKVLREERALLHANFFCVLLFGIAVTVLFGLTKEVWSVALATFLAMIYRCYASEAYLLKKLNQSFPRRSFVEIIYLSGFIVVTFSQTLIISFMVYLLAFACYSIRYRHSIANLIHLGKRVF